MSKQALPVLAVAVLCGLAVLVATLVALGPDGAPTTEAPAAAPGVEPGVEHGAAPPRDDPEPPPGHAVSGRITERGRQPISGASVIVGKVAAQTAEDGTFTLENLSPGSHSLLVSAEGYHLLETSIGVPSAPLELRLRPYREITGIVRLPNGRPAPGVVVRAVGHDKSDPRTAMTDAAGRFRIERLGTGRYSVGVEAFEYGGRYYQPQSKGVDLHVSKPVAFAPEEGRAITGVVLGPDDAAVPNAEVAATGYGRARSRPSRTRTDSDGRFVVIVAPRGEFTLAVATPTDGESGFRYLRWVETNLDPSDGPLEVRLEPGDTLDGRVLGPQRSGRQLLLQRIVRRGFQNKAITSARTGADGRFRMGGLGVGTYMLSLSREDELAGDWMLDGARSFSVPGEAVTAHLVRPLSIVGRVEDAQGRPFGGRSVFVENDETGLFLRRTTNKDGTFAFARVPPGEHTFVALAPHRSRKYAFEQHRCGKVKAGDLAVVIRVEQWPAGE